MSPSSSFFLRYQIQSGIRLSLICLIVASFIMRLCEALIEACSSDYSQLTAFGFAVLFPAVLCALLLAMPPARSSEGILMRIGTIFQLILIICLPSLGLLLLLGLPVTFLIIEVLETKLPPAFRDAIKSRLVQC